MKRTQQFPLEVSRLIVKDNENPRSYFLLQKLSGCTLKHERSETSWKLEQRLKYLAFLDFHCFIIEKMQSKELWGFCRLISQFIGTRNANQCRIYHKKMLKKFQGVSQMLKVIQSQLPEFKKIVSIYSKQLSNIFNKHHHGQAAKNNSEINYTDKFSGLSENSYFSEDQQIENKAKEIHPQQSNQEIQQKIDDKEMVPTDTTIKAEEQEYTGRRNKKSISSIMFQQINFQVFQPIENPVISEIHFLPSLWGNIFNQGFPSHRMLTYEEKRRRQWQECNQMFLRWQSKLNKLISEEQHYRYQ